MNIYHTLMKYFHKVNSNYKTLLMLTIVTGITLLMLVAGAANFISNSYHAYASGEKYDKHYTISDRFEDILASHHKG
jgi:hypothetical protein